ncbi:MAG: cytochrome b N-terminal domain-containing protein [Chloroflexi bacterium]|nr:cytochrome b N-terminal domain-containing protein [Chloroflexota bacterium]MBI3930699.1 cytochrome b N-terminal domain-containing protein [Chloroflexota bacterium]
MPSNRSITRIITQNRVWQSIFRQGYPDTDENQSKAITNSWFLHIHPVRVKTHTLKISYTWGLGVISFYLLVVLLVTGIWLMFYYAPSVERAYTDIQNLETSVTFGMLMRNMHRWAAHLMVLTVFLHMCRVFWTGGHKHPREFNWVVGVMLWLLTLLLSYTGYLLPWDQLAYWAVTVGTNMIGTTPLIGEQSRLILVGALETGPEALVRFYALHIFALFLPMIILVGVHFWRIRKDGGLSSPLASTDEPPEGGVK